MNNIIKRKINIAHIGIHNKANLNSGDTLLFNVVRDLFDYFYPEQINWELIQIWEEFTLDQAKIINNNFDGIVLGGGGLLMKDQKGSDVKNSGWQWNCSSEVMSKINIPLIIFAIGYGRFRGQEDFDPIFYDSMQTMNSKSKFFSLRNNGSIEQVKKYLKKNTNDNNSLKRQFCPTTIISKIYEDKKLLSQKHATKNSKVLAFNTAFDRTEMRFNDPKKKFVEACEVIKIARDLGWKIIVCSHKDVDREIESILDDLGVAYSIKNLTRSSSEEIINFYAQIDLSIGMRGHSQMIPFGLNKPIFSMISHDKVKFFLDDLELSDYGAEMDDDDFISKSQKYLNEFDDNKKSIIKKISDAQDKIWNETKENFREIKKLI